MDGMEITQFTYFQQAGGQELSPVAAELTYGLERITMFITGIRNIFDIPWRDGLTYGEVRRREEVEHSTYAFEAADPGLLLRLFEQYEGECRALLDREPPLLYPGLRLRAALLAHLQPARCARRHLASPSAPPTSSGSGRSPCAAPRATSSCGARPASLLLPEGGARALAAAASADGDRA